MAKRSTTIFRTAVIMLKFGCGQPLSSAPM